MAKSHLKKLDNFDLEKIRRFTEQELAKLSQSSFPFCYQIGTTVRVGNSFVIKKSDKCWQVREGKTETFEFLSRKDAIYYCIALHKNKHELAKEIKQKITAVAKKQGIPEDVFASKKQINQLISWNWKLTSAEREQTPKPDLLNSWRYEYLKDTLKEWDV